MRHVGIRFGAYAVLAIVLAIVVGSGSVALGRDGDDGKPAGWSRARDPRVRRTMEQWNAAAHRLALDPEAVRRVEAIEQAAPFRRAALARELIAWVEAAQTRSAVGLGDDVRLGARLYERGVASPLAESSAMVGNSQVWVAVVLGGWTFRVGVGAAPSPAGHSPAGDPGAGPAEASRPQRSPLPPGRLQEIQANREFAEAISLLADQEEAANWKSAYLVTSEAPTGGYEAVFPVITLRSGRPGEWTKLIYSSPAGGPAAVFFDERNPRPEPAGPDVGRREKAGVGGQEDTQRKNCGPWSAWANDGSPYCATRLGCFHVYAFRATFQKEKRWRQCKNGIQVQFRKTFVNCGC